MQTETLAAVRLESFSAFAAGRAAGEGGAYKLRSLRGNKVIEISQWSRREVIDSRS